MMFADVFLAVELSDDDVELAEVASQCGYDFTHSQVLDVDEPLVAEWHGQPCLLLRLTLNSELSSAALDELLGSALIKLSHPSVSSFRVCAIEAFNY